MNWLTIFGVIVLTGTVIFYALEDSRHVGSSGVCRSMLARIAVRIAPRSVAARLAGRRLVCPAIRRWWARPISASV
jgi:hypothetical protein